MAFTYIILIQNFSKPLHKFWMNIVLSGISKLLPFSYLLNNYKALTYFKQKITFLWLSKFVLRFLESFKNKNKKTFIKITNLLF